MMRSQTNCFEDILGGKDGLLWLLVLLVFTVAAKKTPILTEKGIPETEL